MKTVIKLAIVALIINAAFQAARSYYNYHDFKHIVHMETLNGGRERSDDIKRHILALGAARGYAMSWNDVEIGLDSDYITIDLKWVDTIELVPRFYSRQWPYEGRVQVRKMKPVKIIE